MTYRLERLTPDQLDADQQTLYDNLTTGKRGSSMSAADGSLIGPFDALLHAPLIGDRSQSLGEGLRFDTSLDNRVLELAVCCVGAHNKAEFEWYAHANLGRKAGLNEEILDAILEGRSPDAMPDSMAEGERVVHTFTTQLLLTHRVDDTAYRNAEVLLGDQGVVELVLLIGYYGLVSGILNTFRAPLPEGVEPVFGDA